LREKKIQLKKRVNLLIIKKGKVLNIIGQVNACYEIKLV
jgi:hypothetical protein